MKAHSLESRYRRGKRQTERITARDAKYSNANGNENLTCVAAAFGAASSGSSETSMACLSA